MTLFHQQNDFASFGTFAFPSTAEQPKGREGSQRFCKMAFSVEAINRCINRRRFSYVLFVVLFSFLSLRVVQNTLQEVQISTLATMNDVNRESVTNQENAAVEIVDQPAANPKPSPTEELIVQTRQENMKLRTVEKAATNLTAKPPTSNNQDETVSDKAGGKLAPPNLQNANLTQDAANKDYSRNESKNITGRFPTKSQGTLVLQASSTSAATKATTTDKVLTLNPKATSRNVENLTAAATKEIAGGSQPILDNNISSTSSKATASNKDSTLSPNGLIGTVENSNTTIKEIAAVEQPILRALFQHTGGYLDTFLSERIHGKLYKDKGDKNRVQLVTPSLARNHVTGDVVLGVRIQIRNKFEGYLALCQLQLPVEDTTCEDSGLNATYVPPECDPNYWTNPLRDSFRGIRAIGPEDARLFFQEDGVLGATFTYRGCHEGTEYNSSIPNYSISRAEFRKKVVQDGHNVSSNTWNLIGRQKLLSIRERDGRLPPEYPRLTKSWIPINYKESKSAIAKRYYQFGFTADDMKENIVLEEVSSPTPTMALVQPAVEGDKFKDTKVTRRGSTNFISAPGGLLVAMGHTYSKNHSHRFYVHYWYALCDAPPFAIVGYSPEFDLPKDDNRTGTSFALGLATEEAPTASTDVYVSYSVSDRQNRLAVYDMRTIMSHFQNSSSACQSLAS